MTAFWIYFVTYFLGAKLAEYLLVASHSLRVGKLQRPRFTWHYWVAVGLWPTWTLWLWLSLFWRNKEEYK